MADCGPGITTRGVRRGGRNGTSIGSAVIRKALVPCGSVRSAGALAISASSAGRASAFTASSSSASRSACSIGMRCVLWGMLS